MQLLNPLRTSRGLFHLSVFFFILIYYVNFFCISRHRRFSVPGNCDFLVYCVMLHININLHI